MKLNRKNKFFALRLGTAVLSAMLVSVPLSACSLPSLPFLNSATQVPHSETEVSPEEAIVGTWKVMSLFDPSGNTISPEDIDYTGTPLESCSGMIGMVLKQGVTVEFKDDGTVKLSIVSGNYEISDDKLCLSMPQMSAAAELDFEINGSNMTINVGDYKINLEKN